MKANENFTLEDERKIPYTMVGHDILDSMSFKTPTDKLVYIELCRFAHMKEIFPSYKTLMLMSGNIKSVNTLKAALERLEETGLIKVVPRGRDEKGEHYTHRYVLLKVPQEVIDNSVFNELKKAEKREELKKARKEKAKRTKHNQHVRKDKKESQDQEKEEVKEEVQTPISNFDTPPSNFDRPISNFDTPPSNFEHDIKELSNKTYKKDSNNNQSIIIKEINKLQVPDLIKDVLKNHLNMIEGLIDSHKMNLEDVELLFNSYELPEWQFKRKLIDVLENGVKRTFKGAMSVSLDNHIHQPLNDQKTAYTQNKKPVRTEMHPDWFKEQQKEEELKEKQELDFNKPGELMEAAAKELQAEEDEKAAREEFEKMKEILSHY